MKVTRHKRILVKALRTAKLHKKSIGFVPTMGYLHEGHLSLIRKAHDENDCVVVSIFVNPTQFGPGEDLNRYPRDFSRDKSLLKKEKVDWVYYPSVKDVYAHQVKSDVKAGPLARALCGASRPRHFGGVATVLLKFFKAIEPDRVYFGQKDYQQCLVVRQLIRDHKLPIRFRMLPTVRENDGLALSSRNSLLTEEERQKAPGLYKALKMGRRMIRKGEKRASRVTRFIKRLIFTQTDARVDYVSVVDSKTLQHVINLRKKQEVLIALAVYFSKARLIDNILVRTG